MATVFRNSNSPIWRARFTNEKGVRVSKTTGCTSRRDAEKIAAQFEADAQRKGRQAGQLSVEFESVLQHAARDAAAGDLTLARAEEFVSRLHRVANPDFRVVSLSAHVMEWIRSQERYVSPSTVRSYLDMHRRVIAAVGPKVANAPVGDLSPAQVSRAMEKIHKGGLKRSTVNMDLRALRRALHAAVADGLSKANPAVGVRPMKETDSTLRAPFSAQEVRQMIDHPKTSEEWKGAILIAAHTGLRLRDVVSLSRGHLDGDRIVIVAGKTGKALSVPLTPPALAWIGEKKGSLFPSLHKLKPATLSTVFRRIMEASGVSREVSVPGGRTATRSFHSLRHSFTSWLAEADVHADVRQKLTGHSSSGIHQRYTHHDEALDRAVASLPDLKAP